MGSMSVYNVGGLSPKDIQLVMWLEAKRKFGNAKNIYQWIVKCQIINENQFDVVKTEMSRLSIDILRKRNELELVISHRSRSRQETITINKILSKTVLRFNPHPNDIHLNSMQANHYYSDTYLCLIKDIEEVEIDLK